MVHFCILFYVFVRLFRVSFSKDWCPVDFYTQATATEIDSKVLTTMKTHGILRLISSGGGAERIGTVDNDEGSKACEVPSPNCLMCPWLIYACVVMYAAAWTGQGILALGLVLATFALLAIETKVKTVLFHWHWVVGTVPIPDELPRAGLGWTVSPFCYQCCLKYQCYFVSVAQSWQYC